MRNRRLKESNCDMQRVTDVVDSAQSSNGGITTVEDLKLVENQNKHPHYIDYVSRSGRRLKGAILEL